MMNRWGVQPMDNVLETWSASSMFGTNHVISHQKMEDWWWRFLGSRCRTAELVESAEYYARLTFISNIQLGSVYWRYGRHVFGSTVPSPLKLISAQHLCPCENYHGHMRLIELSENQCASSGQCFRWEKWLRQCTPQIFRWKVSLEWFWWTIKRELEVVSGRWGIAHTVFSFHQVRNAGMWWRQSSR